MKPTDPTSSPHFIPMAKLLSILLLATGMLLASTMTLKASWLWVLAPVGLLMMLEVTEGCGRTGRFVWSGLPFYGALLSVALAFQFVGLSSPDSQANAPAHMHALAAAGCGAGGNLCGPNGGCGSGGCGASTGGACSCSSGNATTTRTRTASAPVKMTAPPNAVRPTARPTVVAPGNRPGSTTVQMPGQPSRPVGPSIQAPSRVSSAKPPMVVPARPAAAPSSLQSSPPSAAPLPARPLNPTAPPASAPSASGVVAPPVSANAPTPGTK